MLYLTGRGFQKRKLLLGKSNNLKKEDKEEKEETEDKGREFEVEVEIEIEIENNSIEFEDLHPLGE